MGCFMRTLVAASCLCINDVELVEAKAIVGHLNDCNFNDCLLSGLEKFKDIHNTLLLVMITLNGKPFRDGRFSITNFVTSSLSTAGITPLSV